MRWKSENICFQKDIASERMIKDIPVSRILSYQSIMWLYLFMAAFGIGMKGHNFFVFFNAETEQVNVVYKRKGNTYGLIEPEF